LQYIKVTTTTIYKNKSTGKVEMDITPVSDELIENNVFIDNEMQDALTNVTLISRLKKSGLTKRSGDSIQTIVYCLCLWPLLGKKSLAAFCGKFIGCYLTGGVHILYDFMKRQNINWRNHTCSTAQEVIAMHQLCEDVDSALVVDDTLQHRRGKGVEGASSHFDHTLRKHVMGHQLLQLVLSSSKGGIPVDQHLYISEKRAQLRSKPFDDGRNAVAKDYKEAVNHNKNELFRQMLKAAVGRGIKPKHVLGDSWFGNKQNIDAVISLDMIAVFAMKRDKTQYRFQGKMYTLAVLHELIKRRMKTKVANRFLTYSLIVELNIEHDPKKEPNYIKVKLLFSKEKKCSKNSWLVLLCTDLSYSNEKIIQVYSRRWAIEVYFKETKQNLGLLDEQSPNYCVHYASIHLTALRYILLFNLMLENGGANFARYRKKSAEVLEHICFATVLWELFKSIINDVLDSFIVRVGKEHVTMIKQKITTQVEDMLVKALRIDEESIAEHICSTI
jgi:hypothetical protein